MAIYYIESDTFPSIIDTSEPDTLIVASTGVTYFSIVLEHRGAWTVRVDGSAAGLILNPGNTSLSKITIGRTGAVFNEVWLKSAVTFSNSGQMRGNTAIILGGDAEHSITNRGSIIGSQYAIDAFSGASVDRVTNLGTLMGRVNLGNGDDKLVNSGKIISYNTTGTSNTLDLGAGADVFFNYRGTKSGAVIGNILLGAGDDQFYGGAKKETVDGGIGSDLIKLGKGNDTYLARAGIGDGVDTIYGGSGSDTYDYSDFTFALLDPLIINLDTIDHTYNGGVSVALAGTAVGHLGMGQDMGFTDTIVSFENAISGSGCDIIYGSKAANFLDGGAAGDLLFGFDGNDTLVGGVGEDTLTGGRGNDALEGGFQADTLTGGQGYDILTGGDLGANDMIKDTFVYTALTDSTVAVAGRDVITDFVVGIDKIDLSAIDAIKGTPNSAFTFRGVGGNFEQAGDLRALHVTVAGTNHTLLEGDVNGDKIADFAILLRTHLAFNANGTDFVL